MPVLPDAFEKQLMLYQQSKNVIPSSVQAKNVTIIMTDVLKSESKEYKFADVKQMTCKKKSIRILGGKSNVGSETHD